MRLQMPFTGMSCSYHGFTSVTLARIIIHYIQVLVEYSLVFVLTNPKELAPRDPEFFLTQLLARARPGSNSSIYI